MRLQTIAAYAIILASRAPTTAESIRGAGEKNEDDRGLIQVHHHDRNNPYRMFTDHLDGEVEEELPQNDIDIQDASPEVNQLVPDPRIIGGSAADNGEHPFMVSLRDRIGDFCAGSRIACNMILTAA